MERTHPVALFICASAVYLAVITATNVANVAFFAQQDQSLKGSAMAFQFLFASLMSCRMVLSLRDKDILTAQSAIASFPTKSFWRAGYTGNEQEQQIGHTNLGAMGRRTPNFLEMEQSYDHHPTGNDDTNTSHDRSSDVTATTLPNYINHTLPIQ